MSAPTPALLAASPESSAPWFRDAAAYVTLIPALLASVVLYWPGMRAPFLGDDYLLLLSSRDMPFGKFLESAAVPWADPGTLQLSDHYWRPLSFLSFRAIYAIFGTNTVPYHLFSLGVHLATVVLVYFVALRLTKSRLGAAVAAVVMAVDPAGFQSVSWIASLNSAGLPFALGGWLAFLRATEKPGAPRRSWIAISVALELIALAFRETSVVIVAAMLLCYLFVDARGRWRERSTWLAVAPPAALAVVHAIALAGVVTPGRGQSLLSIDADTVRTGWFYVKQVVPVTPLNDNSPAAWLQRVVGAAMLALPVAAVVARRWLIAALAAAFLVSIVPYALFNLGYGPRYFYFPCAILSLLAGAVASEVADAIRMPRQRMLLNWAAAGALGLALAGGAVYGHQRVSTWVRGNPDQNQDWVDQLRAQYPTLPEEGGLFVLHQPFFLALVNGYIIPPIVDYEYPGSHHPVYLIDDAHLEYARSVMGPNDRLFIYTYPQ